MHEIKAFKTNDGSLFDSELKAAKYEASAFLEGWLSEVSSEEIPGMKTSKAVAGKMIRDVDDIVAVLNSYIRVRGPLYSENEGSSS